MELYRAFDWNGKWVVIQAERRVNATIALISIDGDDASPRITLKNKDFRLAAAAALCHPNDTYDFDKGVRLACRNALKIGKHECWEKQAEKDFDRSLWSAIRRELRAQPGESETGK